MQDLQEFVDHYLSELAGPNAFRARHSLIEAGAGALPLVIEAFHASANAQVRHSLVELVSDYRASSAVPFLVSCLSDPRPEVWRSALDGMVILGGAIALEGLRDARGTIPRERRPWIDEAMQQIIDNH